MHINQIEKPRRKNDGNLISVPLKLVFTFMLLEWVSMNISTLVFQNQSSVGRNLRVLFTEM